MTCRQDAYRAQVIRGVGYSLQTIDMDNGSVDVIRASIATLTNVLASMNRKPDEPTAAAVEHVRRNIDQFTPVDQKPEPKPKPKGNGDIDGGLKVKADKPKPQLPPSPAKVDLAKLQQQLEAMK